MSRPSADSLAVVGAIPSALPPAPGDLSADEAELWRTVVESKPADWFGPDSYPVLKEYCRASSACDRLAMLVAAALVEGDPVDARVLLDIRDKESKRLAAIATKLRLTQQSRYTPQAASTANRKAAGRRPWEA